LFRTWGNGPSTEILKIIDKEIDKLVGIQRSRSMSESWQLTLKMEGASATDIFKGHDATPLVKLRNK